MHFLHATVRVRNTGGIGIAGLGGPMPAGSAASAPSTSPPKVRMNFPETWLWTDAFSGYY